MGNVEKKYFKKASVVMLSLNEPADEWGGGRGGGLEKPGQHSRDVIYRSKSSLNNIPDVWTDRLAM